MQEVLFCYALLVEISLKWGAPAAGIVAAGAEYSKLRWINQEACALAAERLTLPTYLARA